MERLDRQVDAYVTWKRDLVREITRYRSWLAHNRLNSEAVEARLDRALKLLRTTRALRRAGMRQSRIGFSPSSRRSVRQPAGAKGAAAAKQPTSPRNWASQRG